ncbi:MULTISPECIES: hypothetical protein [Klebsiella/Raoultella group]|uniref:hypothetical protein n=1 Tax=Klebsiella/Raoultella group TaxID=2890311 RepID=UPI000E44DBC2|nr:MULTISPECIES: hypothetical protein [Klebsiella/Raoultella group]MCF1303714.1 hypothetical protein [Raoultella ornithinolytica]RGL51586.1 hypothetical protein DXC64_02030 [Klebsiella pneumoniae]HBQ2694869.1 hypothetical protein [Klebsiella pneumoniae]HBR1165151.1 hypothetical protein [Klebsiella pneumoniae]HBT3887677.1 hypothetical protein [Klebsiella pneumoniae]
MMDYDEWPEILEWYLELGFDDDAISLIKAVRDGIPLYTDQKSALAMVQRLDACAKRYGVKWVIYPDIKMLITARLTERALEALDIMERGTKVLEQYLRDVLFERHAQQRYSERQSKAGSKPREERAVNSQKTLLEAAIKEELPNWTRNRASKLAKRFGVTPQYIRKIKAKL